MIVYFSLVIKPECGDGELQIKFLFDKKVDQVFLLLYSKKKQT